MKMVVVFFITPNLQVRVKVEKAIAILFQQSIKYKRKSFVYAVKGGTTSVRRWHLCRRYDLQKYSMA